RVDSGARARDRGGRLRRRRGGRAGRRSPVSSVAGEPAGGKAGKSDRLTHIDATGDARMVDVTAKPVSARQARATGFVEVSPKVVELLRGEGVPKGDALSVARIAGIMGAKRTPD